MTRGIAVLFVFCAIVASTVASAKRDKVGEAPAPRLSAMGALAEPPSAAERIAPTGFATRRSASPTPKPTG